MTNPNMRELFVVETLMDEIWGADPTAHLYADQADEHREEACEEYQDARVVRYIPEDSAPKLDELVAAHLEAMTTVQKALATERAERELVAADRDRLAEGLRPLATRIRRQRAALRQLQRAYDALVGAVVRRELGDGEHSWEAVRGALGRLRASAAATRLSPPIRTSGDERRDDEQEE